MSTRITRASARKITNSSTALTSPLEGRETRNIRQRRQDIQQRNKASRQQSKEVSDTTFNKVVEGKEREQLPTPASSNRTSSRQSVEQTLAPSNRASSSPRQSVEQTPSPSNRASPGQSVGQTPAPSNRASSSPGQSIEPENYRQPTNRSTEEVDINQDETDTYGKDDQVERNIVDYENITGYHPETDCFVFGFEDDANLIVINDSRCRHVCEGDDESKEEKERSNELLDIFVRENPDLHIFGFQGARLSQDTLLQKENETSDDFLERQREQSEKERLAFKEDIKLWKTADIVRVGRNRNLGVYELLITPKDGKEQQTCNPFLITQTYLFANLPKNDNRFTHITKLMDRVDVLEKLGIKLGNFSASEKRAKKRKEKKRDSKKQKLIENSGQITVRG